MTVNIDMPTACDYKSGNAFLFISNKSFKLAITSIFLLLIVCVNTQEVNFQRHYANEWAVEIDGGDTIANEIAFAHGFINHGKILKNENFYMFSHPKLRKRSIHHSSEHHNNLAKQSQVKWVEQQVIKNRVKRDLTYDPRHAPNDASWSDMWYLLPSTQPNMKVVEAWQEGYTGKNVSVTILDDGIEYSHPDLKQNYDPLASGDINNHDDDPAPRLDPTNENRHGTRCAGEVAAVANNNVCSIGIAYNGKIGGVRMLDGQVTDAVEAASIGLNPSHVDIYSASWGPDDDGRTVDGPAKMAQKAFLNGVTEGRGGKGSIFVWASGNGGRKLDNCNCDGYTNSIYTLSISSTTQRGTKPWYSESCSSTLAATYSSGSQGDKQIVTTDLRHGCTYKHTGTSASAPLAAAICALALEANPDLTWRDMQHLVVQTANPTGLQVDDWVVNAVGRKVSHTFGYGMMDAFKMVTKAREWTLVPPQRRCSKLVVSENETPKVMTSSGPIIVPVEFSSCDGEGDMIERLEHVQAELTLRNERRGDLVIYLTSPSGTRSQLLGQRRMDFSSQGFTKWAFMSTHTWDEDPRGRWSLEVHDKSSASVSGTLSLYNLILYGTKHSDWPVKPKKGTTTTSTSASGEKQAFKSTTTKPVLTSTPQPPQNNDKNCAIPKTSGIGCLACIFPTILDPIIGQCVGSCGEGRFVLDEGDHKKNGNPRFASMNTEVKVPEEVYNSRGRVCQPCSEYCRSCSGPTPADCIQCVTGATFRKSDYMCIRVETVNVTAPGNEIFLSINFFRVSVLIVLTVVVVIVSIYCFCRSITSNFSFFAAHSDYKPVRSVGVGLPPPYSDGALEYRDNPFPPDELDDGLNTAA